MNYLRWFRDSYKIDGYEFAKMMEVSQSTLATIEMGKKKPSHDFMAKAAKALNSTPEIIFPSEYGLKLTMQMVVYNALNKFETEITQSSNSPEKREEARQEFVKVLCQSHPLISASTTSLNTMEVK